MRNFLLGFLLATCAFATGAGFKSSLGDLEGPLHEWVPGKKGWMPVDGVPQRTVWTGQMVNANGVVLIDFDSGTFAPEHLIVPKIDGNNPGEVYDNMTGNEMGLKGSDIPREIIALEELPETVE